VKCKVTWRCTLFEFTFQFYAISDKSLGHEEFNMSAGQHVTDATEIFEAGFYVLKKVQPWQGCLSFTPN
jgi:hypothetical protein